MRRTRWSVATVVVLVALLAAAGCGSDDEATDTAATGAEDATAPAEPDEPEPDTGTDEPDEPDADAEAVEIDEDMDACALFDGADLEALLGAPAEPGESRFLGHGHTCSIHALDGVSRARLTLTISTSHGPENYSGQQDLVGVDSEVDGLGDEAFHSGPYLGVRLGDRFLLLHVLGDADLTFRAADEDMEAAMAIVLDALAT